VPGDFPGAIAPANANALSRIVPAAQHLFDGLQSMMAAVATAGPQANLTQRQVRIVHYHEQPCQRNSIKIHDGSHRFAARIHIRLRPAQQHGAGWPGGARNARIKLLLVRPIGPPAFRQTLDDEKTRIVARSGAFRAGIAETHDETEIFHTQRRPAT
jgi:hypothetical protein